MAQFETHPVTYKFRLRVHESGMSQRAIARQYGVSQPLVSKLYNGDRGCHSPSIKTLTFLGDFLGVEQSELMTMFTADM